MNTDNFSRFFLLVAFSLATAFTFTSCEDNDPGNGNGNNNNAVVIADIIGSWQLTHEAGHEIYNDERIEWDREPNWLSVYTFNPNNTGLHSFDDGESGSWSFTWQYIHASSTHNLIVVSDEDPDSPISYIIEKLNSTSLVLFLHEIVDNFEYYQRATFQRTQ